jgi:hypothetical protein
MPDINDAFPSKYLRASDLGDDAVLVTIARIAIETFVSRETNKPESKPIIFFHEFEKGLLLNKTNSKKISTLLKSSDTDDWAHQQIQIYATETQFGADTVPCIRVKQAALPTKAQKAKFPPPAAPPEREPGDEADPF